MPRINEELYNFNPLEIIGRENVHTPLEHVCTSIIKYDNGKRSTELLDFSCVQELVGQGEIKHMVSH